MDACYIGKYKLDIGKKNKKKTNDRNKTGAKVLLCDFLHTQ